MDKQAKITAPPSIQRRLDQGDYFNGYYFNGYNMVSGRYAVGIGPVSDFLAMAETRSAANADMIVDALRAAFGQPPVLTGLAQDKEPSA